MAGKLGENQFILEEALIYGQGALAVERALARRNLKLVFDNSYIFEEYDSDSFFGSLASKDHETKLFCEKVQS